MRPKSVATGSLAGAFAPLGAADGTGRGFALGGGAGAEDGAGGGVADAGVTGASSFLSHPAARAGIAAIRMREARRVVLLAGRREVVIGLCDITRRPGARIAIPIRERSAMMSQSLEKGTVG
jgi:hypothetical protein